VLAGRMSESLPDGATVLDVGCGDGSIAAATMEIRPDVEITGIDVLIRPVSMIPITKFDGREIPFPDNSFDVVTFVDVLHHTDDPTVLWAEAARVASKCVVIKDHLAEGLLARPTLRVMDWVGNASFGVALPYNYWRRSQWEQAFAETDLIVEGAPTDLGLYLPPMSWICDRQLHVVWRLAPGHSGPGGTG
jgi:SAM-dependent methyltransferase